MHTAALIALPEAPCPVTHQRARGALDIRVNAPESGVSRLQTVRQEGSFRMLFPRGAKQRVDAVMLNTAGGITGGDRFDVRAHVAQGAQLALTTQAAERIYRATDGHRGRVCNTLSLEANAHLFWMPQETILFNNSALHRKLHVDLVPSARFLMVEPMIFGRTASGETLENAELRDSVEIWRDGTLIYRDTVAFTGNITAQLNRKAIGNGARGMANVVLHAPDAATKIDGLRAVLPDTAGASLLADDLLVMRALAADGYALRQCLLPALTYLTDTAMPKNWRL